MGTVQSAPDDDMDGARGYKRFEGEASDELESTVGQSVSQSQMIDDEEDDSHLSS